MTRFYLLFSAAGLFVIALSYGIAPATILPVALNVSVEGTDLTHIFRAIMGLYLGMIVLWVLGAFRANLTWVAVIAEVTFMFGLALGRVVSIVIDGMPSMLLVVYAVLEIAMGLWGVLILKKPVSPRLEP
ncbi:MAG: DUF4345 domain-containing protein [Thiohalocapsa sp. PB-PSB1]|nr:MAG: hypothetical protein N838_25525 [Thiohalocapsa sp. PB-PSB1]QQO56862.1 MAG: DUF4345 domain-containing protein [Thiohalocapsa sp. PB-PSB1]